MERRDFLAGAATAIATVGSSTFNKVAFASESSSRGRLKHPLLVDNAEVISQMEKVASISSNCVSSGQICLQHCQEELIKGHAKEFQDCAIAVQQMISICENTATLSAYRASILKRFLDGCIEACQSCYEACKAHSTHFEHGMHLACKKCMDDCKACIDACNQLKKLM